MKKQYKVEGFIYYTKITLNTQHIIENSVTDMQQKIDEYAANGWELVSTNAASFGSAMYTYLFFEKG